LYLCCDQEIEVAVHELWLKKAELVEEIRLLGVDHGDMKRTAEELEELIGDQVLFVAEMKKVGACSVCNLEFSIALSSGVNLVPVMLRQTEILLA
jgi:hypothetical protein